MYDASKKIECDLLTLKEEQERRLEEGIQIGEKRGILIGKILTLEEILDRPLSTELELKKHPLEALTLLLQKLQEDLRNRT